MALKYVIPDVETKGPLKMPKIFSSYSSGTLTTSPSQRGYLRP